jgi:dTDP-4-amino-4,6-dideoxygalactose transaminase
VRGIADNGLTRGQFAGWPTYAEDETAAALRVLESGRVNYWTGEEGRFFESEYARYLGCAYAVALANGTVAIEAALRALGVDEGDEVVVPARTFIATASAVVACGATPVVCDVEAASGNMTRDTVEPALSARTKALIPVHLAGWPCDMDGVMGLAAERGLFVVEDCAQAHGAQWNGRKVGSFGHASAFSFCQDKIMTTCGEGGMLTTDDEAVWRRAWEHKDHGRDWDAVQDAARVGGPDYKWLYGSFGTNWRMTEVQSAVGRIQLRKLDDWVAARRRNAAVLDARLADVEGLRVAVPPEQAKHAYYKYYAYVTPEALASGWSRDRIAAEVQNAGVSCGSGVCPEIYLEKAFRSRGWGPPSRLPVARDLGETSLMLQVHPTLSAEDMHHAADVVETVMREAVR